MTPSRILMPHRLLGNIYVRELGRAYQALGHEVFYGQENFFESAVPFDVLHLHWPETLYRAWGDGPLAPRVDAFLARLRAIAETGVPIVWTLHNLHPHGEGGNAEDARAYREVAALANLRVHHCAHSREAFATMHPVPAGGTEVIAEHGNYAAQADTIDARQARQRLNLPDDAFVFLLFGNIKSYKGLGPVLDAFTRLHDRRAHLVIAGGGGVPGWHGRWLELRARLPARWQGRVRCHFGHVDGDDVQVFVRAADALVLGHQQGLNSGVAVLGMTFGRLVIGPDMGCIGAVLRAGRNLRYAPGDAAGLTAGMRAALRMTAAEVGDAGEANRRVAMAWTWRQHAETVLAALAARRR